MHITTKSSKLNFITLEINKLIPKVTNSHLSRSSVLIIDKIYVFSQPTVTSASVSGGKLKVNWQKISKVDSYSVYVSTKNGDYKKAGTVNGKKKCMTIKTLNETIARQQQENDNLKAEMSWLKQKLFGSSSERRAAPFPGQMGLFDGEEEKPLELIEPEVVSLPKKSRKKKPTLKEQFENLPTRQVPVDTLSDEDKIKILNMFK